MNGRPYNPDADSKDTRRTQHNTLGHHDLWMEAIREPNGYLMRFMGMLPQLDRVRAGALVREMHVTVAQAQWSRTRGVYRFDALLAQAVDDTPLDGLLDGVFVRLPEWCVYLEVEREVDGEWLHGGYVCIVPEGAFVLVIVVAVVASGDPKRPYIFHTVMINTAPDAPQSFSERTRLAAQIERPDAALLGGNIAATFPRWHELLFLRAAYLCTEEPDVRSPREPKVQPQRKKNNGPVRQWEVGVRFGQAYRQALAEHERQAVSRGDTGERARPRPHVRRAHWRTVLSGPLNQERQRTLRWFPPTFVNADGQDIPVTIWKQKGS